MLSVKNELFHTNDKSIGINHFLDLATRGMLLSSAIASVTFFVVYLVLRPMLHNHALWMAFLTYLAMRGVVQTVLYNKWSRGKGYANKERF